MTSSNGNIFRVTGPSCGEFTGHQMPVNRSLRFSLICAWIKGWVSNHEAGDMRRHHAHYDVTVLIQKVDVIPSCLSSVLLHCHQQTTKWVLSKIFNALHTTQRASWMRKTNPLLRKTMMTSWYGHAFCIACRSREYLRLLINGLKRGKRFHILRFHSMIS